MLAFVMLCINENEKSVRTNIMPVGSKTVRAPGRACRGHG